MGAIRVTVGGMLSRVRWAAFGGTFVGLLSGAEPSDTRRPLSLEIAGCSALWQGGICELTNAESELRFWIPASPTAVPPQVIVDAGTPKGTLEAHVKESAAAPDVSGLRLVVHVRLQADSVKFRIVHQSRQQRFELRRKSPWAWQAALDLLGNAEAIARIGEWLIVRPVTERADLFHELALRKLSLGDWQGAVEALQPAAELALQLGRTSEHQYRVLMQAYYASRAHDFRRADAAIEAAAQAKPVLPGVVDADRAGLVWYTRAVRQTQAGALRQAASAYEQASVFAHHGAEQLLERIVMGQAYLLAEQGRHLDAIEILTRDLESDLARSTPCFRGNLLSTVGWHELVAYWADDARTELLARAAAHLRTARETLTQACPKGPLYISERVNVNLGFVALEQGNWDEALRWLGLAKSNVGDVMSTARRQVLAGEAALAAGDAESALKRFEDVGKIAEVGLIADLEWRAWEGQARSLAKLGRVEEAIPRFRRAERVVASGALSLPPGNGRLGYFTGRRASVQGFVTALIDLGRTAEAFSVARMARRRALVDLARQANVESAGEEGEAWRAYQSEREALDRAHEQLQTLPADEFPAAVLQMEPLRKRVVAALDRALSLRVGEQLASRVDSALREPKMGEALLLWFEARDRWFGFLSLNGQVHVVSKPRGEGVEWLTPFLQQLASSQSLTVLGQGTFQRIDVHAASLAGEPLIAVLPVSYALDLSPEQVPAHELTGVLVAADAEEDLPWAQQEGTQVSQIYRQHGYVVTELKGAALEPSLFRRVAQTSNVLHYAGHARFGGLEGWQSSIPLAGGILTAGDLLGWDAAPSVVILSACEGARAADAALGVGVGLAQAWLLAGSSAVLAPTRPVSDRDASRVGTAFAAALSELTNPTAAYRQAMTEVRGDVRDWAAFRLILR